MRLSIATKTGKGGLPLAHAIAARNSIAFADTWNIASVFPSDAAWSAELERISAALSPLTRFQGKLSTSSSILVDWLQTSEELRRDAGKVYLYARMAHDVDTADQAATAKLDQASSFFAQVQAAMAFAEPEILQIERGSITAWLEAKSTLALYKQYFDQLWRRQPHIRSGEVEQLLSQVADPFTSATRIHGILADADLKFAPAKSASGEATDVAQGNLSALLTSPDRELRRTAWENYADAHLAVKNAVATSLATGVKQHVFLARARNYASSLQAALTPNHIPVEVFYQLIETFRRHLPTWHRYWNVRRRALGYDKLYVYDIKSPLTAREQPVAFEQAIEWISAGMAPLGVEYVATMRQGLLTDRWVDKYPNQGKRAGAYSSGVAGTHPFILMSYNDDLFSMSTLAHELGHSLHSYYTRQTQPLVYSRYGLFVAETASNFNQALVRAHLLQSQPDPDFEIAIIEEAMSNFHRYFFIMPTLARFELELHERVERGEGLTAAGMMELMTHLFSEGYGDEVVIDADRIGITWAQFATHMYANFYVYQYATGISAAHTLAEGVLDPDATRAAQAAENYRSFLHAGSSIYPLDALKLAGVDMTSAEPVERTFTVLARLVDRLEQLIGQRAM